LRPDGDGAGRGQLSAQFCRFSLNSDFIYTLLLENEANELSLMKQGYEKGAVIFVRKIPGTFEFLNQDSMYHFE
jgi:hypothetical protein